MKALSYYFVADHSSYRSLPYQTGVAQADPFILVETARQCSFVSTRRGRNSDFPNKNGLFCSFFSCIFPIAVVIFASQNTPCFADSLGAANRGFLFGDKQAGIDG